MDTSFSIIIILMRLALFDGFRLFELKNPRNTLEKSCIDISQLTDTVITLSYLCLKHLILYFDIILPLFSDCISEL